MSDLVLLERDRLRQEVMRLCDLLKVLEKELLCDVTATCVMSPTVISLKTHRLFTPSLFRCFVSEV